MSAKKVLVDSELFDRLVESVQGSKRESKWRSDLVAAILTADIHEVDMEGIAKNTAAITAENEALREALRWYADEGNYMHDEHGNCVASAWQGNKVGSKARAALTAKGTRR